MTGHATGSTRLFSFEGIDGCGKSTQIALLKHWLEEQGRSVAIFREPGGSQVSEAIRRILLDPEHPELQADTELLLYTASRLQLLGEKVLPALQEGQIVVLDRFADSTTAYQGHGRGLPLEQVRQLNEIVRSRAWPIRTWWLDLSPEEAEERSRKRGLKPDRMEDQHRDFFRRVRQGYQEIAAADPTRILRLDADLPIGELAGIIREDIRTLLAET